MTFSLIDCPNCQGEGYVLFLGTAGAFSQTNQSFEPQEGILECSVCFGEGSLEVCAYCQELPLVKNGRETCACDSANLAKAA